MRPPSFTDARGRRWHPVFTPAVILAAEVECGLDITDLMSRDPLHVMRTISDPQHTGTFLWLPIASEAEARGITPEQFIAAMGTKDMRHARAGLEAVALALAAAFPTSTSGRLMAAHLPRLIRESRSSTN